MRDAVIGTSLMESRLLTGSVALLQGFTEELDRQIARRRGPLAAAILRNRTEERLRHGETVYLLEPNVKRSRGGLRDLQLLGWIARTRYGRVPLAACQPVPNKGSKLPMPPDLASPVLDALCERGDLSKADADALGRATEFLLRLRNELHFHAGRAHDVLDRAEQVRVAERFGYRGTSGMMPVESFMRDYFRHTEAVSHVVTRFAEKALAERGFGWAVDSVVSHRVGNDYRVGPREIRATRAGLGQLRRDIVAVLQLAELANLYDKRIAPETWDVIRRAAPGLVGPIAPEARSRFLSLLNHPARLGQLLRGLHEVELLEQFVPALRHARGLLQFNQYHKYTVDEHCLRAVEQATALVSDSGPLGRAYRQVQQKALLHLALLIHDLGKGYPGDHSEIGRQIADETAVRLGLSPGAAETLKFLVHKHLVMNHLALRRDIDDESVVVRFAVEVGSPERLRMLYVLTACDLGAVGPGVWNSWKAEVVTVLFHRAMRQLAGETPATDVDTQRRLRRDAVAECLGASRDHPWFVRQLDSLPESYLAGTPPAQVADDLELLRQLPSGEVIVRARYLAETDAVRCTVVTREDVAPGIFHRLAGALASAGLEILTAEINTFAEGLVLDRFWGHDPDFAGPPPKERLAEIEAALADSLRSPAAKPPQPRRTWQTARAASLPTCPSPLRVEADNTTSRDYTIVDVFAPDRPGLLYAISRALFEMGLSVWRAKIGTYLDQVVDVFYVTTFDGEKVEDETRLEQIRARLVEAAGRGCKLHPTQVEPRDSP
jgi:[protein-PII] uridylyltransferase